MSCQALLYVYPSISDWRERERRRFIQVQVTKLKLDKDRKAILDRKAAGRAAVVGKLKGKHTEETVSAMEST